jgi:hypothetical protein
MMEKKAHLNLDDFFRASIPITVKWGERDYELTRPQYLSLEQLFAFENMKGRVGELQKHAVILETAGGADQTTIQDMLTVIDDAIKIICPKMPVSDIPLWGKVRIMQFYAEQTKGLEIPTTGDAGNP